jgi:LCP family protein required for cell wall assembly
MKTGRLPRWRYYVRRLVAAGIVLVLFVGVAVATGAGYARFRFDQVLKVHLAHLRTSLPAGKSRRSENILIVGNNTRTGLAPQDAQLFGSPQQVGGARSDVTMVLHLDPATGAASLLSIPRDLFVPLPAHSMSGAVGKIDAALNDGPDNLVAAISGSLGIPIDHYVSINFDQFQNVIDAVGGIPMNFPMPLKDSLSGLNVTRGGCQLLNGFQALAVVRARHLEYYTNGQWHSDPLSDLSRIRRDQTFLRVLVSTIKTKGLNNPLRAEAVLSRVVHDITIDSGLSESDMLGLGTEYRNIDPSKVPTLTLPVTVVGNYSFAGGTYGDVDFPSQPQDAQVIAQFLGVPAPLTPNPPQLSGALRGASGPSIDVQDISGVAGNALKVARQLEQLGFRVTSRTQRAAPAQPTETVVRYYAGELAQAQGVLAALGGAAVLYPDTAVPAGHILLQAGSLLNVAVTAAPGPTATATSPRSSPAPPASTPGSQAITPSVFAPQPYDPTAC